MTPTRRAAHAPRSPGGTGAGHFWGARMGAGARDHYIPLRRAGGWFA